MPDETTPPESGELQPLGEQGTPPKAEAPEEPEQTAAQDIGAAATTESIQVPVISYDEGKAYDAARDANKAGWEATAAELDDRRSFIDKRLKKNPAFTSEDVMHDEALRINAAINEKYKSNERHNEWEAENARHDHQPIDEERLRPATRQGVFEQLKARESDEMSGNYFRPDEVLFNPKGEYVKLSASAIAERERENRRYSEKVNEALAAGDIGAAEQAMRESKDSWHTFDGITMSQHITHKLRELVGNILKNGDSKALYQLVEAEYLSAYIYPNMAIDAGVELERLHSPRLEKSVTRLAADAIEKYGPHLSERDSSGRQPAHDELTRRLDVLNRLGVMSRQEIAEDRQVRGEALDLAIQTTAGNMAEYQGREFGLSRETWDLIRLGLLDVHKLAEDPAMIRIATMMAASGSPKYTAQAKKELRRVLLGEEEAEQDIPQVA